MQNIAQKAISNAQGNGVILFEDEGLIEYTKRLKLKFKSVTKGSLEISEKKLV